MTFSIHNIDLFVFAATYGGAHGAWHVPMTALTILGGGWAVLGLVALMAWPGRPRARRIGVALAVAVVVQATLVWAIKLAVGRVRPWIALGLPAPIGAPHDGSFPSGHAAGSFCVAAFLLVALPAALPQDSRRARCAGYGLLVVAALVAVSRVYLGEHFPSDVLAGAILGAAIGAAAGRLYAAREAERIAAD